jgi:hypothetical protein
MRKKIVIHIGTHKTGTTTIQKSLALAKNKLLSKGILYPDTTRDPFPHNEKHNSVVKAVSSENFDAMLIEKKHLLDEFEKSNCHTMVISEEGLSGIKSCITDFFNSFKDDFDLTVICYLRRQDYFAESLYNQFVRFPMRSESRPINKFWRAQKIIDRFEYHTMLCRWKALTENVHAIDFDQVVRSEGLVKSFINTAQLGDIELDEYPANRSPDMNLILCLNKMNRLGLRFDLKSLINSSKKIHSKLDIPALKYILGHSDRVELLARFEAENIALKCDFGVSFSNALPEGESDAPTTEPDPNYMLALLSLVSLKSLKSRNIV